MPLDSQRKYNVLYTADCVLCVCTRRVCSPAPTSRGRACLRASLTRALSGIAQVLRCLTDRLHSSKFYQQTFPALDEVRQNRKSTPFVLTGIRTTGHRAVRTTL